MYREYYAVTIVQSTACNSSYHTLEYRSIQEALIQIHFCLYALWRRQGAPLNKIEAMTMRSVLLLLHALALNTFWKRAIVL